MKIVVLDGYTLNPGDLNWKELEAIGTLTVYDRTSIDNTAEIIERIGDAEIVFTNKTPLGRQVFDACTALQYVGVLATGYNVVDIQAARERGISVTNIPSYGTEAVAQFTMAMLLEICSRIGHHARRVQEGAWTTCPDFCFWELPLMELQGKTMGIIGFGRIGKAVGRLAKAFGMRVIACANHPSEEGRAIAEYVPMEQLMAEADVISLHCPLQPSTQRLINKASIATMKDGVILLNSSRGPLIDEADLAESLNTGKVYAAALDVVATEPIRQDNPLLSAKNCIITPHIAWAPRESRQRLLGIAVENLEAFLEGSPQNVVNP